jgi:translocation and assembly module TamB
VPGLSIEGLTGPLPSRIGVARLAMTDAEGPWLELEGAEIALDLPALLGREARITVLSARRVALHRLPPSSEPPPPPDPNAPLIPALPELPVSVRLDRLAVERIELGEAVAGVAAVLSAEGELVYAAGRLSARIAARRLDAPAEVTVNLDLAPGADRLQARVEAREPPGGLIATMLGLPDRATEALLTLDGPASGAKLDLRASLGSDLTVTASGDVHAASDGAAGARLTLRAEAAPLLPENLRPIAMPLDVTLDAGIDAAQRVALRGLTVRAPAGEVTAEGSADLAASTVDIGARVALAGSAAFGELVPEAARWDSLRADLRATGPMATPTVALDVAPEGFGSSIPQAVAALGPAPRLTLRATLPDRIEALTLEGAALRVTAEGGVGETLDATLRATVADLAPWSRASPAGCRRSCAPPAAYRSVAGADGARGTAGRPGTGRRGAGARLAGRDAVLGAARGWHPARDLCRATRDARPARPAGRREAAHRGADRGLRPGAARRAGAGRSAGGDLRG